MVLVSKKNYLPHKFVLVTDKKLLKMSINSILRSNVLKIFHKIFSVKSRMRNEERKVMIP
jgi:hypothetical protein